MGIMTKRDKIAIQFGRSEVAHVVADFKRLDREQLERRYTGIADSRDWYLEGIKKNITDFGDDENLIQPVLYAPFDHRFTYYTNRSRGFLAYPVYDVLKHMLQPNVALTSIRKADIAGDWDYAFVTSGLMVHHALSMKEGNYVFPLFLWKLDNDPSRITANKANREENFSPEFREF